MRHEPRVGEAIVFLWGVSQVAGTVAEVYGRLGNRQVVIALDPEESGYVVDEPTTVSLPIEDVRRGDHTDAERQQCCVHDGRCPCR